MNLKTREGLWMLCMGYTVAYYECISPISTYLYKFPIQFNLEERIKSLDNALAKTRVNVRQPRKYLKYNPVVSENFVDQNEHSNFSN